MKKVFFSFLVPLIILIAPKSIEAQELLKPTQMTVEKNVEIRKGALSTYPLVKMLIKGQQVTVIDEFTNSLGEKWYRVDLGNILGWGKADYFSSYTTDLTGKLAITAENLVNVRRGASTAYEITEKLSKYQIVKVIDKFINNEGELWYRVEVNGKIGWVLGVYLLEAMDTSFPDQPVFKIVQVQSVDVRKGAATSYSVVASLKKNQQVKVIDIFKNSKGEIWYRIDLGVLKGWVPESTFIAVPQKTVQRDNAIIRRGASTDYQIVAYLKVNQKVCIIDKFINKNGETWYRIDSGNVIGWTPGSTFEPLYQKTVQINNAPVRRGASADYAIVANLAFNQKVNIIDEYINKKGEKWYRINLGNIIGWTPSSTFETLYQKTVQKSNAPVRRGASADYAIVANLAFNQKVNIIDEYINKKGEKWYRVDLGNIIGWTHESTFSANIKTVQVSSAYVRRGASYDYETITKVTKNQNVNIIDSFINKNEDLWYRVAFENFIGWVPNSIFEPVTQKTVQINKAVVRRGASAQYEIVASVVFNQKVDVIDEFINSKGETWYRVDLGNIIGWTHESTFIPIIETIKEVQANTAFVRRGASKEYTSVAKVIKNQRVKIIDAFTNNEGELWYRIEIGKIKGWVPQSIFLPKPAFTKGPVIIVTKNAVIRAGASTSYNIIERDIPYNSTVQAIDEFINTSTAQRWVKIITPSGKTGWIQEYEVAENFSEVSYIYGLKKGILRRSADENAERIRTLKGGEKLILLDEVSDWYLVEDPEGYRGWLIRNKTAQKIIKELSNPSLLKDTSGETLVWQKSMNFDLNYAILPHNQLKIYGNISAVSLPDFQIKGIKSIEYSTSEKAITISFESNYTFLTRNDENILTVKAISKGIKGKKIIIDAGHGGHDTGAVGPSGLREKDVNLSIAKLLKTELEKAGAIVLLTRDNDYFLELSERTDIANNSSFDAFISIHCDSYKSTSRGTTTFYNNRVNYNGPKSIQLAQAVQKNLVNSIGTFSRGVQEQEFYVNRMNELPSILIEVAFISNPTEEALLKTQNFQQKAAKGIADGIKEYFNAF